MGIIRASHGWNSKVFEFLVALNWCYRAGHYLMYSSGLLFYCCLGKLRKSSLATCPFCTLCSCCYTCKSFHRKWYHKHMRLRSRLMGWWIIPRWGLSIWSQFGSPLQHANMKIRKLPNQDSMLTNAKYGLIASCRALNRRCKTQWMTSWCCQIHSLLRM